MKGWTEKPEIFYEDKSGSSIYLSICLSVHLSVITSYLTDISALVAQIKKNKKKQSPFIFEFCFWEDLPHPVNWSPTHSAGPQKLFFTEISVSVAQIKKIQKT